MTKSSRSTSRASRSRTLVEVGGAAVVSLGTTACLIAWINGESLTVALLSSGAAIAALMNALVAVATFLAGHRGDDMASDPSRGQEKSTKDNREGDAAPD